MGALRYQPDTPDRCVDNRCDALQMHDLAWIETANRVSTEHENEGQNVSLDGRAVANFVLDFCDDRGRELTNLSLQKVVFFCHVWSLIELKRPLVRHRFEAWQFGPVLQYLYREFKRFEDRPIAGRATRINPDTGGKEIVRYAFDSETEELLRRVVDFYSRLRASDLVALSHATGGPWDEVWNHHGAANPGMQIEESEIAAYYSKVRPPFSIQ